jgi:hypothetical protein
MQQVPMVFGGPSTGDGFLRNLFVKEDGRNMGAPRCLTE